MDLAGATVSAPSIAGPAVHCNLCGGQDYTHLFTKQGYRLVRCRSCDLAFIANPPDSAAIAALYTARAAYHDELLDIGCSIGLFLDEARKAGFDACGAELSPETSAFARDHFGLRVHTGDWREAGHADGSFDVVTLFDVIEHLADPAAELAAVRRLLKPGGILLQSTPDIDRLFPRLSYKVAKLVDYWPHPEPPWHLCQFSRSKLSAMTQQSGYRVTRADRTMIGLDYSFGTPASWKGSPKLVPSALAFAPVALLGKWLGQGDWLYLAATVDPG